MRQLYQNILDWKNVKNIFFLAYYGIYFRNSSKTSRFISLLFFPIFKEIVFNIELKNWFA